MVDYEITSTRCTVDDQGVQDRITTVNWDASTTDGAVTGYIRKRGTPIPLDYTPADKLFSDVTEQDCIDWVTDLEDQASIQAQCDAAVAAIENPSDTSGLPWEDTYPLWAVGTSYVLDTIVTYLSVQYECIQAHIAQNTWAPPATPALWTRVSFGIQEWVQPTGSTDAYALGDQVTHNGHLWTSDVDDNVWEPGVSQWTDEGVYP